MMGGFLNRVSGWFYGSSGADDETRPATDTSLCYWSGREDDFVARDVYEDFAGPKLLGPPGRPLRLLALHGTGSNNDITSIQLVSLEWHEKAVVDCLAGPLGASPYNSSFPLMSELPFKTWWRGGATAQTLRPALVGVLGFIDAHGPYDGLYGFSAGAQLVAALSAPGMAAALGSRRSWRFVVCACGVSVANGAADELLRSARPDEEDLPEKAMDDIDLPSLHIIGRKDVCRPMSVELAKTFREPTVVYHDGGHELPLTLRKNAAFKAEVHGFLERHGNCDSM